MLVEAVITLLWSWFELCLMVEKCLTYDGWDTSVNCKCTENAVGDENEGKKYLGEKYFLNFISIYYYFE